MGNRAHQVHDEYGSLERPNIRRVCFGNNEFDTWYGNPLYFAADGCTLGGEVTGLSKEGSLARVHGPLLAFKTPVSASAPLDQPSPDSNGSSQPDPSYFWLDSLHVCNTCFKYSRSGPAVANHLIHCLYATKLPGLIVYADARHSVRRVRGYRHMLYCQNLCLFARLFLDNKLVFFAVEAFDFYVVYGADPDADGQDTPREVPMGFFSKERLSWEDNNLACILVFPPFQRRGIGSLLIEVSYAISRSEGILSGPEHPLSDFGRATYLHFWSQAIARMALLHKFHRLYTTVHEIARHTGMRHDDVVMALDHMQALLRGREGDVTAHPAILTAQLQQWVADHHVQLEKRALDPAGLVVL